MNFKTGKILLEWQISTNDKHLHEDFGIFNSLSKSNLKRVDFFIFYIGTFFTLNKYLKIQIFMLRKKLESESSTEIADSGISACTAS